MDRIEARKIKKIRASYEGCSTADPILEETQMRRLTMEREANGPEDDMWIVVRDRRPWPMIDPRNPEEWIETMWINPRYVEWIEWAQ